MPPLIEVLHLTHTYPGGTVALRDVSLDIEACEFVAVIGQNGSGKTTLVEHFNGMLKPTDTLGRVILHTPEGDLDTRTTPIFRFARHAVYVFQNPDRQIFHDSVFAEIAYGLRNIGVPTHEHPARIAAALESVELAGTEHRNPFRLSRGQRQRLAIAAAMAMEPAVLIADEPTTGQDRVEAKRLLEFLKRYNESGKTVVMISHDMALVGRYASRVIAMHAGTVLIDGEPRTVFDNAKVLRQTNITPPQVAEFGFAVGLRGLLTVDDAVQAVRAQAGALSGRQP